MNVQVLISPCPPFLPIFLLEVGEGKLSYNFKEINISISVSLLRPDSV